MRDREGLQHHPARLRDRLELEEQPRLAGARLRHRRDDLPMPGLARLLGGMLHRIHLALASDELRQPAPRRALQARAQRPEARHLENIDRLGDAFDPGRPQRLELKYPAQSFCVVSVTAIDPVGASVCIREARLVECPIGVYSVCASPVLIERTTASPVLTPTRASSGGFPPRAASPSSGASPPACEARHTARAADGPRARPARRTARRCHRQWTARCSRRSDGPRRSSA